MLYTLYFSVSIYILFYLQLLTSQRVFFLNILAVKHGRGRMRPFLGS